MSLTLSRFCWAAVSLSSAERRRDLYFVMPAASSISARRSVGLLERMSPIFPLLDDRVGLGADPGTHEQVVHVAKATRRPVEQVFAVATAVEPTGDDDLALRRLVLPLGRGHRDADVGNAQIDLGKR